MECPAPLAQPVASRAPECEGLPACRMALPREKRSFPLAKAAGGLQGGGMMQDDPSATASETSPAPAGEPWPRLRLRLVFGNDAMLGPGKAELLEFIREEGSIAGAGRRMGMSYKRAWQLVEHLNAAFREPLVDSARGGARGGGARLTEAGELVLANYHRLVERLAQEGAPEIDAICALLRDIPGEK